MNRNSKIMIDVDTMLEIDKNFKMQKNWSDVRSHS
jgi:hypothetical protein